MVSPLTSWRNSAMAPLEYNPHSFVFVYCSEKSLTAVWETFVQMALISAYKLKKIQNNFLTT